MTTWPTNRARPAGPATAEAVLAEYGKLKDEQAQRIGARDNLTYATLTAVAAAVAGVLQAGRPALLLAVPPVCAVLGWTRLTNDEKVTAIGRYIRRELAPQLAAGADRSVFGWETCHRGVGRRRLRKLLQLAVDLLTFCVPGLAAIAVVLVSPHVAASMGWWLVPVAVLDLAATGVLAWQLVTHADLGDLPTPEPTTVHSGGTT